MDERQTDTLPLEAFSPIDERNLELNARQCIDGAPSGEVSFDIE